MKRDERPFPVGPNLPSGNPKQFVEQIQFWSGMPTLEHRELLA
jgi:hypothetical protein